MLRIRRSFFHIGLCLIGLVTTRISGMELPHGVEPKDFYVAESELKELRTRTDSVIRRKIRKLCSSLDRDYNGNAKCLTRTIGECYKDLSTQNADSPIHDHIKRLIGKKFSTLPNDHSCAVGTLLWLKQKPRDHFLERSLMLYFSNPTIFGATAAKYSW